MLLKIGLLKLNAEGKLEEVEDIDGGGRCTDPLMPIQAKVLRLEPLRAFLSV